MSVQPASGPSPIQQTNTTANAQTLATDLPKSAGMAVPSNKVADNAVKLDLTGSGGISGTLLGRFVRNARATIRLVDSALDVANEKVLQHRKDVHGLAKPFAIVAANIGYYLYASSLLFSVTLKAIIWTPVMLAALASGSVGSALGSTIGLGAKLLIGDKTITDPVTNQKINLGDQAFMDAIHIGFLLGSEVTGGMAGAAAALVAGVTVIPRGIVHLFGLMGYGLLQGTWDQSKHNAETLKEERAVLFGAMYQSLEDSYQIWSLGQASIAAQDYHYDEADLKAYFKAGADPYEKTLGGDYQYPERFRPQTG